MVKTSDKETFSDDLFTRFLVSGYHSRFYDPMALPRMPQGKGVNLMPFGKSFRGDGDAKVLTVKNAAFEMSPS